MTPPGTPPRTTTTGQGLPVTPRTRTTDASTSSPSKRRYVSDAQDVEVVKKIKLNEVELRDRNSVLRGIKPNVRGYINWKRCRWFLWIKNFATVRTAYADKLKKLREASKSGAVPATPTPGHSVPSRIEVIFLNQLFIDPKMQARKARTFSDVTEQENLLTES